MAGTGILKSARTIARMARLVASPVTLQACKEPVRRRFLEAVRPGPGQSVMWGQADVLRVVRRAPVLTPGGKLLPFYTQAPGRIGPTAATGARAPGPPQIS